MDLMDQDRTTQKHKKWVTNLLALCIPTLILLFLAAMLYTPPPMPPGAGPIFSLLNEAAQAHAQNEPLPESVERITVNGRTLLGCFLREEPAGLRTFLKKFHFLDEKGQPYADGEMIFMAVEP